VFKLLAVLWLAFANDGEEVLPHGAWWPPPQETRWIVEFHVEDMQKEGVLPKSAVIVWPPTAVEMSLRPDYGAFLRVGGGNDFRELACWWEFHVTVMDGDDVIYTIGCMVNRDVSCEEIDPEALEFIIDRAWAGTSPLALQALDAHERLGCIPERPFALIRAPMKDPVFWYEACDGKLIIKPAP
jgi:hypothetical protein